MLTDPLLRLVSFCGFMVLWLYENHNLWFLLPAADFERGLVVASWHVTADRYGRGSRRIGERKKRCQRDSSGGGEAELFSLLAGCLTGQHPCPHATAEAEHRIGAAAGCAFKHDAGIVDEGSDMPLQGLQPVADQRTAVIPTSRRSRNGSSPFP